MALLPSHQTQANSVANLAAAHAELGFPNGKHLFHAGQHAGFDLWGPLQRRKYVIALFCLIGAALGYLQFAKTPKTYSSNTRLLISTQAPPSIVNGDMSYDYVVLPTHANLIASELILGDAVAKGNLAELKTFEDINFPISALKEMITVIPDNASGETMTVRCEGPVAEDLPAILNSVVAAYRQNLEDNSESVGKEATDLIQQLSTQLMDEKRKAERRSMELYSRLGIAAVDQNGRIVNPYGAKLRETMEKFDDVQSSLRKLTDRLRMSAGGPAIQRRKSDQDYLDGGQ